METASSSTTGRQKRVLPVRARRGGVGAGVGNCDSDILILETFKRQYETDPLIPLNTPFLLTTNSEHAENSPAAAEAGIRLNTVANERYFARPEVLKAFREQQIIQTPEFESIGESSNVGGRMRPRGVEDELAETSDAAYEKRHRKFETLEKRQRLREKEKLRHEHYKLKERIDQLRAMDSAAFMAVDASYFSPPPPEYLAELEELGNSGSPYTIHLNGGATIAEGERRRREMLDTAYKLEKRYAYLLPPDRVRKAQEHPVESAGRVQTATDDGHGQAYDETSSYAGTSKAEGSHTKVRLPARPSTSTSTTSAPSPSATTGTGKKSRVAGERSAVAAIVPRKEIASSSRLRRSSVSASTFHSTSTAASATTPTTISTVTGPFSLPLPPFEQQWQMTPSVSALVPTSSSLTEVEMMSLGPAPTGNITTATAGQFKIVQPQFRVVMPRPVVAHSEAPPTIPPPAADPVPIVDSSAEVDTAVSQLPSRSTSLTLPQTLETQTMEATRPEQNASPSQPITSTLPPPPPMNNGHHLPPLEPQQGELVHSEQPQVQREREEAHFADAEDGESETAPSDEEDAANTVELILHDQKEALEPVSGRGRGRGRGQRRGGRGRGKRGMPFSSRMSVPPPIADTNFSVIFTTSDMGALLPPPETDTEIDVTTEIQAPIPAKPKKRGRKSKAQIALELEEARLAVTTTASVANGIDVNGVVETENRFIDQVPQPKAKVKKGSKRKALVQAEAVESMLGEKITGVVSPVQNPSDRALLTLADMIAEGLNASQQLTSVPSHHEESKRHRQSQERQTTDGRPSVSLSRASTPLPHIDTIESASASISSKRPTKRRKKLGDAINLGVIQISADALSSALSSFRTPSLQPESISAFSSLGPSHGVSASTVASGSRVKKGEHVYTSEHTGLEMKTSSILMISAIRDLKKGHIDNPRKKLTRHPFGLEHHPALPVADKAKIGTQHEFVLPEFVYYNQAEIFLMELGLLPAHYRLPKEKDEQKELTEEYIRSLIKKHKAEIIAAAKASQDAMKDDDGDEDEDEEDEEDQLMDDSDNYEVARRLGSEPGSATDAENVDPPLLSELTSGTVPTDAEPEKPEMETVDEPMQVDQDLPSPTPQHPPVNDVPVDETADETSPANVTDHMDVDRDVSNNNITGATGTERQTIPTPYIPEFDVSHSPMTDHEFEFHGVKRREISTPRDDHEEVLE